MKPFYIDYPQENDGVMYSHRCQFCKINTVKINGLIENHAPDCQYRLSQEAILASATTPA